MKVFSYLDKNNQIIIIITYYNEYLKINLPIVMTELRIFFEFKEHPLSLKLDVVKRKRVLAGKFSVSPPGSAPISSSQFLTL